MKKINIALLLTAVLLTAISCDNRDPVGTGYLLTLMADNDTLYIEDQVNSIPLAALLTDDTGLAQSGEQITFQTDIGEVLEHVITDDNGFAFSEFWYEGTATGTATISARYKGITAYENIYIVDPYPYILEIWAEPDTLFLGSATDGSTIYAHLTNRDGTPVAGEKIRFSSEEGFITEEAITNDNGYAQATFLYADEEEAHIQITAVYKSATAFTYIEILEQEIILLDVYAEDDTVYIGTSNDNTVVFAHLRNGEEQPLIEERVYFSCTDNGSVLPYGDTNLQGIAQTSFYLNSREELATVTASYEGLTDMVTITIMPRDIEIVSVLSDTLEIYADSDPETYATISVRVLDNAGFPAEGETVSFITSLGYMDPQETITDIEGYAYTKLQDNGIAGIAFISIYCANDESFIDISILEMEERSIGRKN